MIVEPQTEEEISDLRVWLVSLIEGIPKDRLMRIADAIEDAA